MITKQDNYQENDHNTDTIFSIKCKHPLYLRQIKK